MDLGIGRGDSARRVMGKKPTTVAYMEECCRVVRALTAGEKIELDGTEIQMPWATHGPVPIWVAGYGPMALAAAGRVADGIILQLADPDVIRWCMGFVRAARARRRAATPTRSRSWRPRRPTSPTTSRSAATRSRWFPALVSNHVVDLINKYPKDELPEELWRYVENREGYDYLHHAEVGSDNAAFVATRSPMSSRSSGRLGAARALEQLREAGVTQFNIYLMNGEEEEQLDLYGREDRARASAESPSPAVTGRGAYPSGAARIVGRKVSGSVMARVTAVDDNVFPGRFRDLVRVPSVEDDRSARSASHARG